MRATEGAPSEKDNPVSEKNVVTGALFIEFGLMI